ncbi:MAG TPA: methyltransferase domain-containing protein [Conexibacter sp.]|nr:methyltransferase domain-containing protein [Conexibacter sp.]
MSALSEPAAAPPATTADPAPTFRANALAALEAGRPAEAHAWLTQALAASVELEWVNDLAVLAHQAGRVDEAEALLRAALAIEPARADAADNLAALETTFALRSSQAASSGRRHQGADSQWRRSRTLGGPDPGMYERAFPGMPRPDIISEHTSRYAYALGLVGGAHVLDLGCGTGYGSEMLSWSAASVRGFDLWRPEPDEQPSWPGVAALSYGHDLCEDPLPSADVAVMFEVIEHLPDAPRALAIAFGAVETIVGSFPNPVHHGSWMNRYHLNDWPLEQFERELERAAQASGRFAGVELIHHHQALKSPLLAPGRDPEASFWVVVARGVPAR